MVAQAGGPTPSAPIHNIDRPEYLADGVGPHPAAEPFALKSGEKRGKGVRTEWHLIDVSYFAYGSKHCCNFIGSVGCLQLRFVSRPVILEATEFRRSEWRFTAVMC